MLGGVSPSKLTQSYGINKIMYAIIYWESEGGHPKVLLEGESPAVIKTFIKIKNADKYADEVEFTDNCRVISLDGVQE